MASRSFALATLALAGLASLGVAQSTTREARPKRESVQPRSETPPPPGVAPRAWTIAFGDDEDRPRLGITTRAGSKRDTLGLLVDDVTADGPAARAGIEEGDRIASINGVSLRLASADAGDEDMDGVATRRLMRELAKLKAGDEAELKIVRDGQTRTVKVKTTSRDELLPRRMSETRWRREQEERAVLGIGLGSSGSKRDTLGILVASLTDGGPADKAGMEEGDRIAAINGVDLRVPAEDMGDPATTSSRIRRLNRAMDKVKPGDDVELRVMRSGQSRTVKLKTVAAKELSGNDGGMFIIGDGAVDRLESMRMLDRGLLPLPAMAPMAPMAPMGPKAPHSPRPPRPPREPMLYFNGGTFDGPIGELDLRLPPEARREFERGARALRQQLRSKVRMQLDDDDINDAAMAERMPRTRVRVRSRVVTLD